MMEKIVQTAGRTVLGNFVPEFVHYNDDVLFGENRNNHDIEHKTRCILDKAMDGRIELLRQQLAKLRQENEQLKKENQKLKKALSRQDKSIIRNL